jgi:hypothetical protein
VLAGCNVCRGEGRAYADVNMGYVANDVVLGVEHGKGGDAFVVHELEGVGQGLVAAVAQSVYCFRATQMLTYLMAMTVCDPMRRSLTSCGYS